MYQNQFAEQIGIGLCTFEMNNGFLTGSADIVSTPNDFAKLYVGVFARRNSTIISSYSLSQILKPWAFDPIGILLSFVNGIRASCVCCVFCVFYVFCGFYVFSASRLRPIYCMAAIIKCDTREPILWSRHQLVLRRWLQRRELPQFDGRSVR
jgi:hypothetical protein